MTRPYADELILAYVPEADWLTFDQALSLALDRDEQRAAEFIQFLDEE